MRVGKVEGSPEEIKNILENNDLTLEEYLEKPEAPLHWRWLVIPGCVIVLSLLLLVLLVSVSPTTHLLFFLAGTGGTCWLATSVQIRFKNPVATFVASVGPVLILLVAAGFLAPKETVDAIKGLK